MKYCQNCKTKKIIFTIICKNSDSKKKLTLKLCEYCYQALVHLPDEMDGNNFED